MIIDFLTGNLKNQISEESSRAQSAETALKTDTFAEVQYNASAKTIDFYNGFNTLINSIDASDFIIDGMVENVSLSGNILEISFNTDSGKQSISIDLTQYFNPASYWTSAETQTAIDNAKIEIASEIPDVSNFVTSAQVETQISEKSFVTSADLVTVEEVVSTAINDVHYSIPTQVGRLINDMLYISSGQDPWRAPQIERIVKVTQAEYDFLVAEDAILETTLYIITE